MRGEGPPLLLLAGLGQGSWVWRDVLPALAGRWRTVAFDNAGTGRSLHVPARSSIADIADDAAAALEERQLGAAHVVGFSMGGYAALTLALARPALVRALVLAGTGAGGPGRVSRPAHVATAFEEAFGLPYDQFARRTMPYTFAPGWSEANPERFEEILAARRERPTSYETIDAHTRACYRFYADGCTVERIDVPALVVHGDEDLIVPVENGRALAARLPQAEYVELAGRGHNLMLEAPETFAAVVLEFLEPFS